GSALISFGPPDSAGGWETINLQAGQAQDTITVQSTPDSTATTINTTAGGDNVQVVTTGAQSRLTIVGDALPNTINIQNTGPGSVAVVQAGVGSDTISLIANGANSGI